LDRRFPLNSKSAGFNADLQGIMLDHIGYGNFNFRKNGTGAPIVSKKCIINLGLETSDILDSQFLSDNAWKMPNWLALHGYPTEAEAVKKVLVEKEKFGSYEHFRQALVEAILMHH
jgi:hypothetical protein